MLETGRGVIVLLASKRGYGFIKPDEGESDIYFHALGCISPSYQKLREGMEVEFAILEDEKRGRRAIGVVAP